jgi:hypothetical protein
MRKCRRSSVKIRDTFSRRPADTWLHERGPHREHRIVYAAQRMNACGVVRIVSIEKRDQRPGVNENGAHGLWPPPSRGRPPRSAGHCLDDARPVM